MHRRIGTDKTAICFRPMNARSRFAFTLKHILVALTLVVIVAAILLPVLFPAVARTGKPGQQKACASNLHQLGVAIFAYVQDYDDCYPVSPSVDLMTGHPAVSSIGWAGKIYPYVKSAKFFDCPDDLTDSEPSDSRVPVSYAMNSNLASAQTRARLTAPARTVLCFEVSSDAANVTLADEGIESQAAQQVSAAGDGVAGALINQTGIGSEPPSSAVYATGKIDNSGNVPTLPYDLYRLPTGRHANGSNFLAADGHVTWERGTKISAGENARASPEPQSPNACKFEGEYFGKNNGFPCAEGVGNGAHVLTFSTL